METAGQKPISDFTDVSLKLNTYKSTQDITNLLPRIYDELKTDFLSKTKGDFESYTIGTKLWVNWLNMKINNKQSRDVPVALPFRRTIIDNNLANITNLMKKSKHADNNGKELRIYLLLFGIILLHEFVVESLAIDFNQILSGKINKEKKRKLLARYIKINNITTNSKNVIISDFTQLRDIIAHGRFLIKEKEEKIYLYFDEKLPPVILKFQDIYDIHDIIMVKYNFIMLIPLVGKFTEFSLKILDPNVKLI